MRIAFDHQIFCLKPYGGISRYFVNLVQALAERKVVVKVFAPLHQNRYADDLLEKIQNYKMISEFPFRTKKLFTLLNQLIVRKWIAEWSPDIVHETYFSKFSSASRSYPSILTVYDMIHELFPKDFSFLDRTSSLKRIAANRAKHIICISHNTKNDLIHLFGIPDQKITVIHLGFNKEIFSKKETSLKKRFDRPFLLFVGPRSGYKNFKGLLKAVTSSKILKSDFDIIAFGGGRFSKPEIDLIRSLDYQDGQVRHISGGDDLLSLHYQSAAALIYPSFYEGFGIPPLEAMASQCPVIVSDRSAIPEVVGPAAEYFNPEKIDNIRNAIETVVYSNDRIKELISLGEQRLVNFSWEKCAEETLKVYKSIV